MCCPVRIRTGHLLCGSSRLCVKADCLEVGLSGVAGGSAPDAMHCITVSPRLPKWVSCVDWLVALSQCFSVGCPKDCRLRDLLSERAVQPQRRFTSP